MHLGNLTLQSPKNHKVEMEVSSLAGESEVGVDRELWGPSRGRGAKKRG